MDRLRTLLNRAASLFHTRRLDDSLDEELRAHIEMAAEENIRRGIPEAEARRLALREFGGVTQVREAYRAQRGLPLFEQIRRDVRFGLYQLWKSPGFAATAILTLALGVGANTTIFSMINGLLLRPLPVPQSDRLAVVGMNFGGPRPGYSLPEPIFRGIERRHGDFSSVFAFDSSPFQVQSGASSETISGQYVSGTFFEALEMPPLLGRTLTPQDDRKGGAPSGFAVVIGETFWNSRLHRDPAILGRRMVINGVAFTVVGVMPRSFFGADPLRRPQLFVPLADEEVLAGARSMIKFGPGAWWLCVMGRLAPAATVQQASSQLAAGTTEILRDSVPDAGWVKHMEDRHVGLFAEPGSTGFTYVRLNYRKPLVAVFAMCAGILLLACLNLASLLLARGTARQRELATRMALGASRMRLIEQLLIEGLLLGFAGAVAGLALAPTVSRLLIAVLLSGQQDTYLDTSLDARVFAFAAGTAVFATLLFALIPAVKATSRSLMDRIKDGQNGMLAQERRAMLPRILLGAEVSLALLLVIGAGLVATSLVRLYTSGVGFDPRSLENISFKMEGSRLQGDALISFYREAGQRIQHLPGVTSVSFARMVPLTGYEWDNNFPDTRGTNHDTFMNSVAPDYFRTMRIPLLAGRDFTWNDTPSTGQKVILNHAAAQQLFPEGNALGATLRQSEGNKVVIYQVVGIVDDAKYDDLRSPAPPTAYLAITQTDTGLSSSLNAMVRTSMPPSSLAGAVREITAQMAPSAPAPEMSSMEKIIDDSLGAERMMTMLAVFFAICALVVTAVGLYGTLAYTTARRTTEIGIRMALGAQRAEVARMVFSQNLWIVMGGAMGGVVCALIATRALASFLFQTTARDPWVFALSIFALALTACAASLLPALRASRIEPMAAIRCE